MAYELIDSSMTKLTIMYRADRWLKLPICKCRCHLWARRRNLPLHFCSVLKRQYRLNDPTKKRRHRQAPAGLLGPGEGRPPEAARRRPNFGAEPKIEERRVSRGLTSTCVRGRPPEIGKSPKFPGVHDAFGAEAWARRRGAGRGGSRERDV